jgi:protein gp37
MSNEVITRLRLVLIVRDPELQPRVRLNPATLTQYAEDMLAGIEFPPVVVYRVDGTFLLTQGFTRCQAAEDAALEEVDTIIREGTREDAAWDAAGSNKEHDRSGMRRTNKDKWRAVRIALKARTELSDSLIAEQVGVDHVTVAKWRKKMEATCEIHKSTHRTGADGRSYSTTRKQGGSGASTSAATNGHATSSPDPGEDRSAGSGSEPSGDEGGEPESESEPEPYQLTEPSPSKPAARPTFNQTNEMVDWARWTWNPVTGCEHNCVYCYARDMANRIYPEKFAPTYRPERLDAPGYTTLSAKAEAEMSPVERTAWRNVFVCSMADLFGRWVPREWIDAVLKSCAASPQWNYLFLTKFPNRYEEIDFPATAWVGTSVDEQKRVANAEKAFLKVRSPVKWLSVEPMRERLRFSRLDLFDWVVIGGQSRSSGAPEFFPPFDWVADLWHEAKAAGCAVYFKPNTWPGAAGWLPKEYPKAMLEGRS